MEFSGGGFKSHSDQPSIATYKNSSVVNTIWISVHFCQTHVTSSGLNITFLSSDRLCSRNDVMSDKVNFRPDIRQNFF